MLDTHALRLAACALALSFLLPPALAGAEPTLDDGRRLYLNAQYEESLALLAQLQGASAAENSEIATYQVFCLIALGRNADAARTIEAIVSADPFYQPSEQVASPRVRDVFRQTRRKVLPDIVRREYTTAKLAFDRKDPSTSTMFERVLKLLGDPDLEAPVTRDLRVLAEGFRDLSRTFALPPAASGAARPATVANAGTSPASVVPHTALSDPLASRPAREGDPDVVPPVVVSQTLPRWAPLSAPERAQEFTGVIEVLIDERGAVKSATIRKSVHPQYDPELLRTARSWKFKPATRDGKPLAYTKLVEVRLRPAAR